MTLTFDLLTLKVVSESHVTWATSVPILVFLGLSVLDLGPMYATDRRQTKASLNAPPIRGGGIINKKQTAYFSGPLCNVVCVDADRPGPPEDVTVSSCKQTFAVVTWSPGAANNAPITGFIVYYVTSHDSARAGSRGPHIVKRVGASDVSARVELAPWNNYTFSVAAENNVGVGSRSEAASVCKTRAGPPGRSPNHVCTKSGRPDQLIIVWEVRHSASLY